MIKNNVRVGIVLKFHTRIEFKNDEKRNLFCIMDGDCPVMRIVYDKSWTDGMSSVIVGQILIIFFLSEIKLLLVTFKAHICVHFKILVADKKQKQWIQY